MEPDPCGLRGRPPERPTGPLFLSPNISDNSSRIAMISPELKSPEPKSPDPRSPEPELPDPRSPEPELPDPKSPDS